MGENEKQVICAVCGAANESDATYCKKCGKRVDGKIPCNACNEPNETDALFCKKCGKRLREKAVTESVASNPTAASNPVSAPKVHYIKVCPSCGKANSEYSSYCLRCSCSLSNVETTRSDAEKKPTATAAVTPTKPTYVSNFGKYDTAKHVISILLALSTLLFVFLVRMEGTFLYELFGDSYKILPDKLQTPYKFGAAVYMISIIGVCVASVLAIVCDLMYFFSNRLPDILDKAWAVWAYLVYAAGITLLQTVLNGSSIVSTLGGSSIAGLIIGGMLAALYTYVHLQDCPFDGDGQFPRVLGLCMLITVWVLIAAPQFSLSAEGTGASVGVGHMALLIASQTVDATASVDVYVAGQIFQLFIVFALSGMVWFSLFQDKINVRIFVQTGVVVLFALLHLIFAYKARGAYLDLFTTKNTGGWDYYASNAAQTSDDVTLGAAKSIGIFILCLGYAVTTVTEYRLRHNYR